MLSIKLSDRNKNEWIRQHTEIKDDVEHIATCSYTMRQDDNREYKNTDVETMND